MSHGCSDLQLEILELLNREHAAGTFSAASCRIAIGGQEVVSVSIGEKAAFNREGKPIASADREPSDSQTLFDLASVTKVFSAWTLLGLVRQQILTLDAPIANALPEYADGDKSLVTLRHLLTHSSGLPATWYGWRRPLLHALRAEPAGDRYYTASPLSDRPALEDDLLRMPLSARPGTRWEYSCAGFNTAMLLAERVTRKPWADLVRQEALVPLGINDVTFTPELSKTAATEYQPEFGRGVVRGIVHDESSWSLGGACANAGLFGTSASLLVLGEAIRLGIRQADMMWENQLPNILQRDHALDGNKSYGASLGLRIGQTEWMGTRGISSRGHTGFTGTSFQVDRDADATIVLLTNSVHPSRHGKGVRQLRAAVADSALRIYGS